ncbi:hypothetical protein JO972_10235 [Verrucomicrobiaceae bacterium 5K15]|uniref:Uncharacterized protein n=1 Tax=Oceaniferula flava TaxID=2800421 RepID=A0AAE2SDC7_9BACT|nr:hypothetical protein [Oceaniferula flavus]MBK1855337.1 hypothetical protein [Oceaniferula flavus]MBM1136643.1 hypothetical protein [Oceaniferula flavus]
MPDAFIEFPHHFEIMKPFQRLFTSAFFVGTFMLGFATSTAIAADTIAQTQPVITFLKTVKEGDLKQLKSAFSEKMQAQCKKEGWDKLLQGYQRNFKEVFSDYKLDDFTLSYKGNHEKGRVLVVHKGYYFPSLSVIKEKAEWKLNQH